MTIEKVNGIVFVTLQATPFFSYSFRVNKLGNFDDKQGVQSVYGWAKHLREKNWWDGDKEAYFIEKMEDYFNK